MTLRMSVSHSGKLRLSNSGSSGRFDWQRAARVWADEATLLVRGALENQAPVGKGPDAGRLRDSIHAVRRVGATSVTIEFYATAPYTRFVLDGTQPHVIRAVRARYLHWVDAGGQDRFAKQVNHPGTRPNRFPQRALAMVLPAVQHRYAAITAEAMRSQP
jgi:hypothetical protein